MNRTCLWPSMAARSASRPSAVGGREGGNLQCRTFHALIGATLEPSQKENADLNIGAQQVEALSASLPSEERVELEQIRKGTIGADSEKGKNDEISSDERSTSKDHLQFPGVSHVVPSMDAQIVLGALQAHASTMAQNVAPDPAGAERGVEAV